MKTTKQLIDEVSSELNAVRAADMGLEALAAFAQEALNQQAAGDVLKTKEALDNLLSLTVELRKAIPANVVPASAGPVGKSPKEHQIENAAAACTDVMAAMQDVIGPLQESLQAISRTVEGARQVIAAAQGLPKEPAA